MGWPLISSSRRRAEEGGREDRMARALHVTSIGKRRRDHGASARGPLLLRAALTAFVLAGGAHAQTAAQTPGHLPAGAAPPSQNFANGKPSAAQKAMQDAIPLTPEMIEDPRSSPAS